MSLFRAAIDGLVPYRVAGSGITDDDRQMVLAAIEHWHSKTRIRFWPRTTESDYVKIVIKHSGGGGQSVLAAQREEGAIAQGSASAQRRR